MHKTINLMCERHQILHLIFENKTRRGRKMTVKKTLDKKTLYEIETQIKYCSLETLQSMLEAHKKDIRNYAYIVHDKDVGMKGEAAEPHFHCMLRLNSSRRRTDVASWIGLSESYIQDSKTNDYGDMLLYLIHENAPEKHQYSESEVTANFAYSKELEKVRAKKTSKQKKKDIILSIMDGKIREYNIHEFVDVETYDKYYQSIEHAFKLRRTELEQRNTRDMEVIYIYGYGGTGKSTYAETIAKKRGFSYKRSSSERDPLGSYKGQDCFILDDVRWDSFSLKDWLGILDNHQDRDGGSRYHDKNFTECKLMIITSTDPIEYFLSKLSTLNKEDPHQLSRRIKTVVRMTMDKIYIKRYDEISHSFGKELHIKNDIFSKFGIKKETHEEQIEKLSHTLGIDKSLLESDSKEE